MFHTRSDFAATTIRFYRGSPSLVQGRPYVVVARKNTREYDGGWSIPGPSLGRPGADQAPTSPGALHDRNGGCTRFVVPQVQEARAFPREIQRNVDDSRGAAVVS